MGKVTTVVNAECGVFTYPLKLDKEFCDKLISIPDNKWTVAKVEDDTDASEVVDDVLRQSEVFWTNDKWVIDAILPFMEVANELSGLMYQIDRVEDIQITKYEAGSFYDFHVDGYANHNYKDSNGRVRKLSMTIQLNDDYEGGEFQICYSKKGNVEIETLDKTRGTVVVFPSDLEHRVKKVTKGTRYSLVAWFLGLPLK